MKIGQEHDVLKESQMEFMSSFEAKSALLLFCLVCRRFRFVPKPEFVIIYLARHDMSVPVASSSSVSTPPNSTLRPEASSRPCPARYKKSCLDQTDLVRLKDQVKFDESLVKNTELLEKQLHQHRLKSLRELSSKLKEDSWKFESRNPEVDKLLSLYK